MLTLLYPFAALASVAFGALVWLLAPWLARYVDAAGNLPRWCRWAQTFDDNCFALRRPEYGSMIGSDVEVAAAWLRRNPGYGLDLFGLGVPWDASAWSFRWDGQHFSASGPRGAFNRFGTWWLFEYKFGWKASNMFDPATGSWSAAPSWRYGRIPLCCTVKRRKAQ